MRTFYSAQDIEELAGRGTTQLVVDDTIVLTDLAREAAQRLGVRLVSRPGGAAPPPAAAPVAYLDAAPPVVSVSARNAAKPAGCQHGPLGGGQSPATAQPQPAAAARTAPGYPNTVVDQMVGLVRQLAGKR